MRCPKCKHLMYAPREIPGGLPGIKYWECGNDGTTRPQTPRKPSKAQRARDLTPPKPKKP